MTDEMVTGPTIEWGPVRDLLARRALVGLVKTIRWTEERAKHYAPVRKIFDVNRGGGGRRGEAMNRDRLSGFGLRDPSKTPDRGEDWDHHTMRAFARSRPQNRIARTLTSKGKRRAAEYGHPNSARPVFALASGERLTGDYRRYDAATATLTKRGHEARSTFPKGKSTTIDPNEMLSAHGNYEVRTGRAVYTKVAVTKVRAGRVDRYAGGTPTKPEGKIDPVTGRAAGHASQIGGRLREEIYSLRPNQVASSVIDGFVISPTYYGVFQEYGTTHNRSHPYMRPALYDARQRLERNIRSALNSGGGQQSEAGFASRTQS